MSDPLVPQERSAAARPLDRRTVLGGLGGLTALAAAPIAASAAVAAHPGGAAHDHGAHALLTADELGFDAASGRYALPPLPYDPAALEPVIDAETMSIHHGRHHAGYVRGLNRALDRLAEIRAGEGDAGLIKHWSRELSFHGCGHVNHALFWQVMAPPDAGGGGSPVGDVRALIDRDLGGEAGFRVHFAAAAKAVEASGWAWLVWQPGSDRLMILQGERQQDLMLTGVVPILGIDVWEHAYYLKYRNRRGDYVDAWFDVVNWPKVDELLRRVRG